MDISACQSSPTLYTAILMLLLTGYAGVVVSNAWLSDDAYITFRTVDNFINGYGLTWNVGERVQTYTHPLWMLLLSGIYAITREIFFSSLLLSIGISLLTVLLVALYLARVPYLMGWGIMVFALSKAFTDYSTSGLENPLTHLLLTLFLIIYIHSDLSLRRTLFWLSFIAALGIVNRSDTFLLYLPMLLYALIRYYTQYTDVISKLREWRVVAVMVLGAWPLLLWELFSLFYYGFLFPNTAYAKLNAALISRQALVEEGIVYLLNSLTADPLTLVTIVGGLLCPWFAREWRNIPIAIGSLLYVLYVVYVGGDFMSGRFLTAPLLAAVVIGVSSERLADLKPVYQATGFVLVVVVGLLSPYSPVRAQGEIGARTGFEDGWVRGRGIIDERANYYHNTGLLRAFQVGAPFGNGAPSGNGAPFPDHDWAIEGRAMRQMGNAVVVKGSVGFLGYFAGPQVHVVDLLALGDALLARLPPADPDWYIGHFGRVLPAGYIETLTYGENRIEDPHLAAYYDKLSQVIQGDLFDGRRLLEVWRLNAGAYDAGLEAYAYFYGKTWAPRFQIVNPTDYAYVYAYVWNNNSGNLYLLDALSYPGADYELGWHVTPAEVQFEGNYVSASGAVGPLSEVETLNVGVIFAPGPELTVQDKYEYRYWFKVGKDGQMTIILPSQGWHSAEVTQGYWERVSLYSVLKRVP
ncbi:MAG: hypothetical protein JXA33_18835 [Anaerolineae bacterium]|nr:hypothetical protein [Anaerolineae bacterium]